MQKITPFLWFDNQAEEAVKFYTSIFKNSRIGKIARYDEAGEKVSGRPKGSVMTVESRSRDRNSWRSMAVPISNSMKPYRLL